MLFKKMTCFIKSGVISIAIIVLICSSGCSNSAQTKTPAAKTAGEEQIAEQSEQKDTEEIIEIYLDCYHKAAKENKINDLETIRSIVNRFGENGYAAIDSKNQVDMTEAEQVDSFCDKVDAGEKGEIVIIEVSDMGGFVTYDLQTKDGIVDVVRSYYKYENDTIQEAVRARYRAQDWEYTEEGYLLFSGNWFSEEQYVLTPSEAEEQIAFRIQPLDETYRELNRKYLMPIGYEKNNMFLVDWNEEDYGTLNFYDMFDILYPMIWGEKVPYVADDNLSVGVTYRIPKEVFESVIMSYFHIDSETLQSKTTYFPEDAAYEYKPRGFYESEYFEYPYSEVVGFHNNNDGTITLTVNVVFPYEGDSKVYVHEVTVRPLEDGGVVYVSNRIVSPEEEYEKNWHTPRLTGTEWEELYESGYDTVGESR